MSKLIIAVNKMDECNWSRERFDQIRARLEKFLKTIGFKKNIFIPLSGFTGENVARATFGDKWYCDQYCLLTELDSINLVVMSKQTPFRLPVIEVHDGKYIVGKIESGELDDDNTILYLMPSGLEVNIDKITIKDTVVKKASVGEHVVVSANCNAKLGDVLCSKPCFKALKSGDGFTGIIEVVDFLSHRPLITRGYCAVLHIHTAVLECEIISEVFLKRVGSVSKVVIQVKSSVYIEPFKKIPQLGRFILRDEFKTIAIGKVISLKVCM